MTAIQIIRSEAFNVSNTLLVGRSPARTLLGGLDIPGGPQGKFVSTLDLITLQMQQGQPQPVPSVMQSGLFEAAITTPGGGGVGKVESFQNPLQPRVEPFVIIKPYSWPPPASLYLWQHVLPQDSILPGLEISLLLPTGPVDGEITLAPTELPYIDLFHVALAAQASFNHTIRSTAHGAPVVAKSDTASLLGMLIGTQRSSGQTLCNIFPAEALPGGGA